MKFYIDTEFVHGNLYMADIIDISLLSDCSEHLFHVYIKYEHPLPAMVTEITGLTNEILNKSGLDTFKEAMDSMTEFIKDEIKEYGVGKGTLIKFVAHGGFETDFPFLFNNCDKNHVSIDELFKKAVYQDSMVSLQLLGYNTPGLSKIAQIWNLDKKYERHSSHGDVLLLKKICDIHSSSMTSLQTKFYQEVRDASLHKMPLSFLEIKIIRDETAQSYQEFIDTIHQHTKAKTALRNNNYLKICNYFINRKDFNT